MSKTTTNLPAFIYQETQFNSSDGRIVLRRHIVSGKEPAQWREFWGVANVDLPIGERTDGSIVSKAHQITFPFFGVSTKVHKNVLRCVEECFKVYDEVETKAKEDTLTEYKAAVRKHLAESKESGVVVPSAATAGERHLDRDGNEIPAPARPTKKSVIIGA